MKLAERCWAGVLQTCSEAEEVSVGGGRVAGGTRTLRS